MTIDSLKLLLAIEFDASHPPQSFRLPTEATSYLADAMAADLLKLASLDANTHLDRCGLAAVAALFDVAQVLRPGLPLFASLFEWHGREAHSKSTPQVIVFGDNEGQMADPRFVPDLKLMGAPMLYLPVCLIGEREDLSRLQRHFDSVLFDQGMAGASIALHLTQALSCKVVHAQWLTLNDVCAMTAAQLQHLNLDAAWQMIEAALFAPDSEEATETALGARLHFKNRRVEISASWLDANEVEKISDALPFNTSPSRAALNADHNDELARKLALTMQDRRFELRQIQALLRAHDLEVVIQTKDA